MSISPQDPRRSYVFGRIGIRWTGYRDDWLFPDGEEFHVVSDGYDIMICSAEDHRGEPLHLWRNYWASGDGRLLKRVGKKAAGRLLDGRTWDEFPEAA